jgi:hypothetical protein
MLMRRLFGADSLTLGQSVLPRPVAALRRRIDAAPDRPPK